MRQHSNLAKDTAEKVVKDIRRATREQYSAEEKIRIVLEGLRGEDSIAELCRREGIAQNLYYRWSKDFLEAGKKRLAGDTARAATSDEVKDLRREAIALKEVVADLTLENRLLKKSVTADGDKVGLWRALDMTRFTQSGHSLWASTPAGFVSSRHAQKFLNIRLNQAEPDISVELLAPLVQHEARTAFYPHLVCVLVVSSQPGERVTIVNALLDSDDIDAMGFCYLTLNVPSRNVPTVSEKRTAEVPQHLIENTLHIGSLCHLRLGVPLLDRFHE